MRTPHLILVSLLLLVPVPSNSTVIRVDCTGGGDYLTTEEGVEAASEGDTVLVAPGIYETPAFWTSDSFHGKNLSILSEAGLDSTTMLGCFNIFPGRDSTAVLRGFTLSPNASLHGRITCAQSAPRIVECVIRGTHGHYGGGINCWGEPAPTFVSVIVESCYALGEGGGLYAEDSSVVLRDCVFTECLSQGEKGCGIRCWGGAPTLEDVLVERCGSHSAFSKWGIGIALTDCDAALRGVVVSNNPCASCPVGGISAVLLEGGSAVLEGVVVSDNFVGHSIYVRDSALVSMERVSVVNDAPVVMWGDPASTIENSVLAFGWQSPVQGGVTISHSCIFGWSSGDSLDCSHYENIFVDPLFCDHEGGDFTLQDDSPCLPENNPWGVQIGAYGAGGCGTGVDDSEFAGDTFRVHAPVPTPSSGPVRLSYSGVRPGVPVELSIYDVRGALVRSLVAVSGASGTHTVVWNGLDKSGNPVASGVYYVKGASGTETDRTTLVILR